LPKRQTDRQRWSERERETQFAREKVGVCAHKMLICLSIYIYICVHIYIYAPCMHVAVILKRERARERYSSRARKQVCVRIPKNPEMRGPTTTTTRVTMSE